MHKIATISIQTSLQVFSQILAMKENSKFNRNLKQDAWIRFSGTRVFLQILRMRKQSIKTLGVTQKHLLMISKRLGFNALSFLR